MHTVPTLFQKLIFYSCIMSEFTVFNEKMHVLSNAFTAPFFLLLATVIFFSLSLSLCQLVWCNRPTFNCQAFFSTLWLNTDFTVIRCCKLYVRVLMLFFAVARTILKMERERKKNIYNINTVLEQTSQQNPSKLSYPPRDGHWIFVWSYRRMHNATSLERNGCFSNQLFLPKVLLNFYGECETVK